jgi:hypothetical protein
MPYNSRRGQLLVANSGQWCLLVGEDPCQKSIFLKSLCLRFAIIYKLQIYLQKVATSLNLLTN